VSHFNVYVTPDAWQEIKNLPARMRQRMRKAIEAFAENPRPAKSKVLELPDLPCEVRRLRLDRWRIVALRQVS